MRWSGAVRRVWRLGAIPRGSLTADPEALRIALDALIENAVQHTGDGDAIELRAHADGRTLAIEVADEGPGIPDEALERIFERFARADAARTRSHGGVGLGLAIVAAIADSHGGGCRVRNEPRGACFTLALPRFAPARVAPDYAARV
jgi:signal transduction histidine kinase